ncbi:hypothetical protein RBH29_11625 [Herbivorax sp. ANBcel31]|uniref:hypothetical protein n=1 Tax=Herbivorax sp. ANBcel31 TaxID=3069754 RepID=UPI0027B0BCC3|nr:hypothetical protein [Herbivorax sp. ANBcel31]MDQ2087076.1 hypothetical protein [Herbivorax sp. ANBcel31]
MYNKKDVFLIISVVVISLLILITYTNTKNLNNQIFRLNSKISRLQSELYGVRSQVSNEISSISGIVEKIRDDARWWTPGEFEIEEIKDEEAIIKVDWQLNKYQTGSNVFLNYRQIDEDSYTQVESKDMGNGHFIATFPASIIKKEPVWDVHLTRRITNQDQTRTATVDEEIKEFKSPDNVRMYEYFISLEHNGTARSSEIQAIHLSPSNLSLFSPLNANVYVEENRINAHIIETMIQENAKYKIQEALLEARDENNKVLKSWNLNKSSFSDMNEFVLGTTVIEDKESYESLFLVVNYNDGITSEREVKGFKDYF